MADTGADTPQTGGEDTATGIPTTEGGEMAAGTPLKSVSDAPQIQVEEPAAGDGVEPVKKEDTDIDQNSDAGSNPFDIQPSEILEDPNQVNVHQFYPELEHQFMKSNTKFALDQTEGTGKAIQEMVQEDSGLKRDQTTDSSLSRALVPRASNDNQSPWSREDENNSADPQKTDASGGVFSTAVSEDALEQAKARQQRSSIFEPEHWGMEKPYQPSLSEITDESALTHYNKALTCKEDGDHKGVILWTNKALFMKTDDVRFFVERAEAYIRLCDFQSAILNYKKACLLEPANDEYYSRLSFLYYFQGQCLFDQRLYPEALEAFSKAAEMQPDNVGYHIRSITCLAALQRHGECLALVNKRLETDMDNPDLFIMRARLHEMFRNTTLCYYDVKDALSLNPAHKEASNMMNKLNQRAQDNKLQAMQLNLLGKHREALQKISIAIETDPAVAEFHVHRGALHRKLGDYNAAIDDFLLALDKCDHNEDSPVYTDSQRQLLLTYNDFAVECFTKGFYEEAVILLNKAIKGEKREKGLYVNRGDCFFRQEEYNFAVQDYHQALEIDPDDQSIKSRISVIHNEFGVNAYQDKLYSEAEMKMTLAIEFNPKVGQYYISRSRARYMLENMSGARGDLMIGLLLDPTNEDVISILSRLFPGKSVADVIGSRAAETAKHAIKAIFTPVEPPAESVAGSELVPSEGDAESGRDAAESDVASQLDSESTAEEGSMFVLDDSVWKDDKSFPSLQSCMVEKEFHVKLVTVKQEVNTQVKTALKDRQSLRYEGPRMVPLPPPAPKTKTGGRAFRKEKIITPQTGKKTGTNWRQFSMGIGLGKT